MSNLYKSFLLGAASLMALNAAAADSYTFKLQFDDYQNYKVEKYSYSTYSSTQVELTSNSVSFTEEENSCEIRITPVDGYTITKALDTDASDKVTDVTQTSASASSPYTQRFSMYVQNHTYSFESASIASLRDASFTVTIDKPEKVQLRAYWTNETYTFTNPTTTIPFISTKEVPFTLTTTNYSDKIYKVEVDGNVVEPYYGSYTLSDIHDDSKVDITVEYPDVQVPVTFSFDGDTPSSAISATINGESVDVTSTGIKAQLGSSLVLNGDTGTYKYTDITVNGTSIMPYGSIYFPYTTDITSEDGVAIKVNAHQWGTVTMNFNVDHASNVSLYYYGNSGQVTIPLVDGDNAVELSETLSSVYLQATSLGSITGVTYNGEKMTVSSSYYLTVAADASVVVTTHTIERNKNLVVYFNDQEIVQYNNLRFESNYNPTLNAGYTHLLFDSTTDGDLQFGTYPKDPTSMKVWAYLNGTTIEPQYEGGSTYMWTPTDGDVLKVYVSATEPSTCAVSFTAEEGVEMPAVSYDVIKTLANPVDGITVLPGTEFTFAAPTASEGHAVAVKVNGTQAVPEADGTYKLAVNGDSNVTLEKVASGIEGVNADSDLSGSAVYNLQGIRVDGAKLPAGIYIKDGRKMIVR